MNIVIQLFGALVGSWGFSLIFNARGKTLITGVAGGVIGWAVYLVCKHCGIGVFEGTVIAAAFCQMYAETFARILKTPTTVIYIPAIVPLVPGGSLYYTMYYGAISDWVNFKAYGIDTVKVAFGIAVGASFVSAILLLIPRKKT